MSSTSVLMAGTVTGIWKAYVYSGVVFRHVVFMANVEFKDILRKPVFSTSSMRSLNASQK